MYSMMEKKIFCVLIFKCVGIENSDIDILLLYLEFFFVHGMLLNGKNKKIQSFANVLVQILSQ